MTLVRLSVMLAALMMVAALASFGAYSGAQQDPANQNANSNVNTSPQNSNSNTTPRANSNTKPPVPPNANTVEMTPQAPGQPVPSTTPQDPAPVSKETASPTVPMSPSEQTDLSGTYAGTFDCAEAGLTGDTTLTVTGNQFTTADGKSGRIVATTTHGYTSVALQFGEAAAATTPGAPASAPMILSLRARKKGERLTLMSVPGSRHQCSFTPAAATARKRRTSKPADAVPAATGVEAASPAEAVPTGTTPATPATPPRRSTRRPSPNVNANSNVNSNSNPVPTPSPEK